MPSVYLNKGLLGKEWQDMCAFCLRLALLGPTWQIRVQQCTILRIRLLCAFFSIQNSR